MIIADRPLSLVIVADHLMRREINGQNFTQRRLICRVDPSQFDFFRVRHDPTFTRRITMLKVRPIIIALAATTALTSAAMAADQTG
ncbi:MAG: hypothetical protein ABI150_14645, partial [Nitrobacter sp.]